MNRSANYTISKNELRPQVSVDSFFFHNPEFLKRNDPDCLLNYVLYKDNKLVATIYIELQDNLAISIPKSPFGSFDCVPEIAPEDLTQLINYIKEDLIKDSILSIEITQFPRCYDPLLYDVTEKVLENTGFHRLIEDINQYLEVKRSFKENIQPSQRRYLNFSKENNFTFRKLDIEELNKAYELIVASREIKNYPVTMSYEQLKRVAEKFNNAYYLFGFFDKEKMIASSICIAVNDHILYDFYHGDDLEYRKHSPVVPLIDHLAQFAQAQGFSILDLGVSTENGKINKGLFDFKKNLGAKPSEKATFQLDL